MKIMIFITLGMSIAIWQIYLLKDCMENPTPFVLSNILMIFLLILVHYYGEAHKDK